MQHARLTCLIVEDEPLAAEVLEGYIKALPHLEWIATCPDALVALEQLQKQPVDLIFLDIRLPKISGLDFLRSLPQPPQVILTTAYHQYALEGYELDVVDYLLKPIEFSRFVKAVNKIGKTTVSAPTAPALPPERAFRFFNVNKKKVKVYLDEVLYIESLKEYIQIHTLSQKFLTLYTLGDLAAELPESDFLRVHRSYLLRIDQVTAFGANEIELGDRIIPIGRSYKLQALAVLNKLGK